MRELITEPDETRELRLFLLKALGLPITLPGVTVMGTRSAKGVGGGLLFERYTGPGGSIHIHWATKQARWLTHEFLQLVAIYVFDQLGCVKAFGEIKGSNTHGRTVADRLGFAQIAEIKDYFPNDSMVVYEITRQGCPWLPADYKPDETAKAAPHVL